MKKRHPIHRTLQGVKHFFSGEVLRLAPWVDTARYYNGGKFCADARAALNVTVLAIPQAIAYAAIADLPIIYGIMCSAVAATVAPWFAGSRHTILGPTNATAFMLFSFFATSPALLAREVELMPLLVMLVGFFCILGALLRVADLLQYISRSVLVGYIAGAAVLIIANQGRHVFGVSFDAENSGSFLGQVTELVKNLPLSRWPAVVTALSTFLGYMLLQRFKPGLPNFALMMLASATIWGTLAFHKVGAFASLECFSTFGPEDLMPKVPNFAKLEIFDDIATLTGVAMAVAFLASLENTAMARTLASRTGEPAQVNQDMFSVGIANVASALCGAMPASGSLTRSALNESSGARTRCSSLFCGIYTFVIALVISYSPSWGIPLIDFVPKAALGALIIGLAFQLVNRNNIRICLRSTPDDAAVLVVTFLATLLAPLHTAIFLGVALSIVLFLRRASRPHVVEFNADESGDLSECHEKKNRANPSISLVHVEGDLFFGATEIFRTQIQRITQDASLKVIILRLKNARHLDATSVIALEELSAFVRSQQRHLIISGCPRSIYRVLRNSGILAALQQGADRSAGESNVFCENSSNPNLATRAALKRAQQLLGTNKADVVIFVDQNKMK